MVTATHTWLGPDSYVVGLLALAAATTLFFSDRVPVALLLFGAGLGPRLRAWRTNSASDSRCRFGLRSSGPTL